MDSPVKYSIIPSNPAAHLFSVTLVLRDPDPAGQLLTLPAWIRGSYMIRDFARNIVRLSATCGGDGLQVDKQDKQTWKLGPCEGEVVVEYEVYAWDLSVRAAHLDQTHGYFNGTSVFLRVVGREEAPHEVTISSPEGDGFADWKVDTTLPASEVDGRGVGRYVAADYEALVDYPVEMGTHAGFEFEASGVPHRMVLSGRQQCDERRIAADLVRICSYHASMYGDLPVEKYLFMTLVTGDGYGGLEHRDSTSLMCAREDLPRPGLEAPDEGYRRFLGLCSHEYFHLWNVKRITPERLMQSDLGQEAHTQLLWAFEGFTSYYDDLALVRSECIDSKSYLELLSQTITRVMRGSGRLKQSVAESSFDAWTKFYKQDENAPNAIVSYYSKGALVALGLDVTLRDRTADAVTLDDLMRALWQRHGKPGVGVPEGGVESLASELAGSDLGSFFERYVYGTDELPLAEWLTSVGVGFSLVPAEDPADQGKCLDAAPEVAKPKQVLGARWSNENGVAKLTHVFDGGAAQAAGLSSGDRLIALDGLQAFPDKLAKQIDQGPQTVTAHAFRRDELMAFHLTFQPAPEDTARLWLLADDELTDSQRARRAAWLAG